MTPAELKQALDKAAEQCAAACDAAMASARRKYVVPFCDKHACRFTAGMGSWSFDGGGVEQIGGWNSEDLPQRLRAILQTEYPLNRGQDCGSMMQDYTPKNYKPRR
jgi:hypothetical protein